MHIRTKEMMRIVKLVEQKQIMRLAIPREQKKMCIVIAVERKKNLMVRPVERTQYLQ